GADKNLTPEEELKKRQQELEKQTKESMAAKIDNLPASVKDQAKKAWETGDPMSKVFVIQLAQEGSITPSMFLTLLKCVRGEQGDSKTKESYKTLAEKKALGLITADTFEMAFLGLESKNAKCIDIVEQLVKGKISETKFERELQKIKGEIKRVGKKEAIPVSPEWLKRSTREKLEVSQRSVEAMLNRKIGTVEDKNRLENLNKKYKNATDKLIATCDGYFVLCKEMAQANANLNEILRNILVNPTYMGAYALPDPIRKNEASIPTHALESALAKLNLKNYITRFAVETATIQAARQELAEVEEEIGLLFDPLNREIYKNILIEDRIKGAGKWLGIDLKEGTRIKFLNRKLNLETNKYDYYRDETEILSVYFESPGYVEEGKAVPEYEGMPIVIVTGVGEFNVGTLRKWMDGSRAYQNVKTLKETEKIIELTSFGFEIKEGMELEYDRNKNLDEKGNIITETHYAKIERIEEDKIILDKPVVTAYKEDLTRRFIANPETGELEQAEADITKKTFTFGEFTQWFLRKDVRKKVNTTEELNKAFAHLHKAAGHDAPTPAASAGTTFFRESPEAGSEVYRIDSIDPEKNTVNITKNGGKKQNQTFAQFLDTARKRNLTSADTDAYADRAVASLSKDNPMYQTAHDTAKNAQEEKLTKALEAPEGKKAKELQEQRGDPCVLPPTSKIREFWNNTTMLSLQDIVFLVKSIYEFHVRRWQRRMKWNTGKAGELMPIIATEMARQKEAAENEEVEKYKAGLEHLGIFEVRHRMWNVRNRDELKACMLILTSKGHMRWDDKKLWKIINEFTDPRKRIPIPLMDDPAAKVKQDPDTGKWLTGQDLIEGAVDAMWGEGIFGKWFNENNNAYDSGIELYKKKGDQLENDPKNIGGLSKEMQKLLTVWKRGGWVNPHQYEGLYHFSIQKGKMAVEDKVYFLIQGAATGLLSLDRIGLIDGLWLNHMPWLDFFTNKNKWKIGMPEKEKTEIDPATGKPKGNRPYKLEDYQRLAKMLDQDGDENAEFKNAPGPRTKYLLWNYMLPFRDTHIRTDKALQESQKLDHDDTHFVIPLLTESMIERALTSGGTIREHFSQPGYLNAYPGFNENIKVLGNLAAEGKETADNVREALASFIRYDSIIDNRYKKKAENAFIRIDPVKFNDDSVVDPGVKTIKHRSALQKLILDIGRAYGHDFSLLFTTTPPRAIPENNKLQEQIEDAIANFNTTLANLIATDNGAKMTRAIQAANLSGYKFLSGAEYEKRKTATKVAGGESTSETSL
ncbi:hypothetical protein HZA39_03650, partial [Candidatus Peregrinibacteria bacterium]|nr:hypothetical protein [Candidatus Peregrinibacteria bacterium]